MNFTRRSVTAGLSAALAMPALLRHARGQSAPIRIGMVLPVTGPAAESGRYSQTGAKIAVERVNKAGGVSSRQVELVIEDDQTTNPGVVLAFSKLAAQPDIVAFLGSIRSTQSPRHGAGHHEDRQAGDVRRHRSRADQDGQSLDVPVSPQRHLFRPGDRQLRREDARQEELGDRSFDRRLRHRRREGAVGSARPRSAAKHRLDQGYPNQAQDFTPVVLAIKHRAPTSSAPISPSTTTWRCSRASCVSSA